MMSTTDAFCALKAEDLMSKGLLVIPDDVPMRSAARMLARHRISGAPVVDRTGKLVGVITDTDFVRYVDKSGVDHSNRFREVDSCAFQQRTKDASGNEIILCDLPAGVCSLQRRQRDVRGAELITCGTPNGVFGDWQIAIIESVPMDLVRTMMTRDVVTFGPQTPIWKIARTMINARLHRVIVVDANQAPIGVISSTDVLSAVAANANPSQQKEKLK